MADSAGASLCLLKREEQLGDQDPVDRRAFEVHSSLGLNSCSLDKRSSPSSKVEKRWALCWNYAKNDGRSLWVEWSSKPAPAAAYADDGQTQLHQIGLCLILVRARSNAVRAQLARDAEFVPAQVGGSTDHCRRAKNPRCRRGDCRRSGRT